MKQATIRVKAGGGKAVVRRTTITVFDGQRTTRRKVIALSIIESDASWSRLHLSREEALRASVVLRHFAEQLR